MSEQENCDNCNKKLSQEDVDCNHDHDLPLICKSCMNYYFKMLGVSETAEWW